jgi:hypothetical protein
LQDPKCLDVPPELAEAIFNEVDTNQPTIVETTTALRTDTATVLSTATVTVLSIATQTVVSGVVEYTTVTVTALPSVVSEVSPYSTVIVTVSSPPETDVVASSTDTAETTQATDQLSRRGGVASCAICPGNATCDVRFHPNIQCFMC